MDRKVLVVAQTSIFGGAETVLLDFIKDNRKTELFVLTNSHVTIRSHFEGVLAPTHLFTSRTLARQSISRNFSRASQFLLNIFRVSREVRRLDLKHSFDIVYGNNSTDIISLFFYGFFLDRQKKIILHVHDMLTYKKVPGWFLKLMENRVSRIVVPSNATKSCLSKIVSEKKIITVYNGVRLNDSQGKDEKAEEQLRLKFGITPERKNILFVGSITQRKRPDLFLSILSKVNRSLPVRAIVVGEVFNEVLFRALQEESLRQGLEVDFLKGIPRGEVYNLMKVCDCLLLTSDRDPFPTVILEAMVNNCLVVVREVDGATELVEDCVTGFTFPYNETELAPSVLARALLLDANVADEYRARAYRAVEQRFSLKSKVDSIEQIFREVSCSF